MGPRKLRFRARDRRREIVQYSVIAQVTNHALHHFGVNAFDDLFVIIWRKGTVSKERLDDGTTFGREGLFLVSDPRGGGDYRVRRMKRPQSASEKLAADGREMIFQRQRLTLHM